MPASRALTASRRLLRRSHADVSEAPVRCPAPGDGTALVGPSGSRRDPGTGDAPWPASCSVESCRTVRLRRLPTRRSERLPQPTLDLRRDVARLRAPAYGGGCGQTVTCTTRPRGSPRELRSARTCTPRPSSVGSHSGPRTSRNGSRRSPARWVSTWHPTDAWGPSSGGQAARAALASVLLSRYDVLLLDEPTNNLTRTGSSWSPELRERSRHGPVLGASHDRAFLDRVVTDVAGLDLPQQRIAPVHSATTRTSSPAGIGRTPTRTRGLRGVRREPGPPARPGHSPTGPDWA